MNNELVQDMRVLKAMERQGLIKFCNQTGCKIEGLYTHKKFTCYYIDEAKEKLFEYKGEKYMEKYFDGCFYPYIIKII